jgi:hypothetical protein
VGVVKGSTEGVGRGIRFLPSHGVYDVVPEPLEGEAEAEDDVVGARHPQRALGLEDTPARAEPPHVELVVLGQTLRANRVTMPAALPGAVRWRRLRS